MTSSPSFAAEREELNAIFASGVIDRESNVGRLLEYVCRMKFEGRDDQIKEYSIAVEAFGRPDSFDKRRDSIVRVEALRLRKRLADYYAAEGAGRPLQIVIPPGHYVPDFVPRDKVGIGPPSPTPSPAAPAESEPARRRPRWSRWVAAAALVLASVGVWWRFSTTVDAVAPTATLPATMPAGEDVRIDCGLDAGSLVDRRGHVWTPDRFFDGGDAQTVPFKPIRRTKNPNLYLRRREGNFRYDIPLAPGVYELRLHFAEVVYGDFSPDGGGESSRVFNVDINDKAALRIFDVLADAAGPDTATVKVFKDVRPAADGKLHLRFTSMKEKAFVNAIEIRPTIAGKIRPIRLVASDQVVTDRLGRLWEPDDLSQGGRIVTRQEAVNGTRDPELHRSERYGNFSYLIPVARGGRYGLTLLFAETWMGPGRPGGGGIGSRLFDIQVNGIAAVRRLDVFREAGGSYRAIERSFHGLEPNAQDKLVLSFVPVENYAMINALEVLDESR